MLHSSARASPSCEHASLAEPPQVPRRPDVLVPVAVVREPTACSRGPSCSSASARTRSPSAPSAPARQTSLSRPGYGGALGAAGRATALPRLGRSRRRRAGAARRSPTRQAPVRVRRGTPAARDATIPTRGTAQTRGAALLTRQLLPPSPRPRSLRDGLFLSRIGRLEVRIIECEITHHHQHRTAHRRLPAGHHLGRPPPLPRARAGQALPLSVERSSPRTAR
jgi:hypothetical protein